MTHARTSDQMRHGRFSARGQSLVEYAVLVAAVASAMIVMSDYVRRAFNAHVEMVEQELNGATVDNTP